MIYETIIKCGSETYVHLAWRNVDIASQWAKNYKINKNLSIDRLRKALAKIKKTRQLNHQLCSLLSNNSNDSIYQIFYSNTDLLVKNSRIANLMKKKLENYHRDEGRVVISQNNDKYDEVKDLFKKIIAYRKSYKEE